jgi:hypothetical protein
MKIRQILYFVVLGLSLSGIASAGLSVPTTAVPVFTPWGAMLGAAVLGLGGVYTLLKKK